MSLLNRPVIMLATGIGLSAAAGSGFLAVVNHSLPPVLVAPLPGLYFLLAAIGTGMFAAFEMEMTRAVSRALALGHDEAQVIRHQTRNAAWVGIATMAVVCAAGPYVTHHWMYGNWVVFAELLVGLVSIWAAFLIRGVLSGRQQFRSYAMTMVVEGLAKLLPSILLAVTDYGSTWAYGLVFALGSAAGALSGLLAARAPKPAAAPADTASAESAESEPETANQAAVRLARLTGGILAGQLLMYAVPLVVTGRLHEDEALVATLGSAVGLTRLALLIVFPLQAPMLPKLTAAAAHGRMGVVRRTTAALVAIVVAASLAAIVGTGLFGPWVLRNVMGTRGHLSAVFLMELAAGTLFLMVANILQTTLTALNRQQTVLWSWSLGAVAMMAIFPVPFAPLTTAAVASLVGPVVTCAVMAADVLRATRRRIPESPEAHEQGPDGMSPARPQDRSVRRIVSSR